MLDSVICRAEHFRSDWFAHWAQLLGLPGLPNGVWHRKEWEWATICPALHERGKMGSRQRGLGFAVGQEPLASFFASLDVDITATDLTHGNEARVWEATGQLANTLDAVFKPEFIDRETFDRLVTFRHCDMNDLSHLPRDTYDFLWSSCAMEHIGSLERGLTFVKDSAMLLKPGGIAVHTTEFNLTHLIETADIPEQALYRESDLRQLDLDLRQQFCCLERLDLFPGTEPEDVLYDFEPYYEQGHQHLKLAWNGYVMTSVLLIVKRFR